MTIFSDSREVTIANLGTLSSALETPKNFYLAGFIHPAIDTSTAVTFQVSHDGNTYYPLNADDGNAYSIDIDNSTASAATVDPTFFYTLEYVKFEVADAQTGAKTITAIIREY
jgi:hypothetical protein